MKCSKKGEENEINYVKKLGKLFLFCKKNIKK